MVLCVVWLAVDGCNRYGVLYFYSINTLRENKMLWLKNISFRLKFIAPIVFVICLFTALFALIAIVSKDQARVGAILTDEMQPVLEQLEDGYRDIYQVITAGQGVILADGEPEQLRYHQDEFQDNATKALPRLLSAQRLIDIGFIDTGNKQRLQNLEAAYLNWVSHYQTIVEQPDFAAIYYQNNRTQIDRDFEKLRSLFLDLRREIQLAQSTLKAQVDEEVQLATVILEVGIVVTIITSFLVAWLISGLLLAPLKRLSRTMDDIATGEGDLTQRIVVESNDEIGQLARSFNEFVSKIHRTVAEVALTMEAVQVETQQIQKETEGVVVNATSQQEESSHAATAVHEMSATSDNVSQHANEAAQASKNASSESETAKGILASAVLSIHQLADEIESSSVVISHLERDVGNIVSILDVIRGIADQTNLLALNAAIEAARAGEQGRGFAVVADEVRTLASKTQDSTGEIQVMIERLQQGAREAVQAMDTSRESGTSTVEHANTANESIDTISHSINIISEMNLQIAAAATQQSQVSEDINRNVQKIAGQSQEMVCKVQTTEQAFESLANQCKALERLIGQFRT